MKRNTHAGSNIGNEQGMHKALAMCARAFIWKGTATPQDRVNNVGPRCFDSGCA